MMEETLNICHRFINNFGKEFNNLFSMGASESENFPFHLYRPRNHGT